MAPVINSIAWTSLRGIAHRSQAIRGISPCRRGIAHQRCFVLRRGSPTNAASQTTPGHQGVEGLHRRSRCFRALDDGNPYRMLHPHPGEPREGSKTRQAADARIRNRVPGTGTRALRQPLRPASSHERARTAAGIRLGIAGCTSGGRPLTYKDRARRGRLECVRVTNRVEQPDQV